MLFLDDDGSGVWEAGESLIADAHVQIRHRDGSSLLRSAVNSADLPDGVVGTQEGLTFASDGEGLDGRVGVFGSQTSPESRTFQAYDSSSAGWFEKWGRTQRLEVTSPQDVGRVLVDFVALDTGSYGLDDGSYARIEVYDRDGNQIDRVTTDQVAAGESGQLMVEDAEGRIASIAVYGHAETEILVSAVEFGKQIETTTDESGAFQIWGLAEGEYVAEFVSPNLTYGLPAEGLEFVVQEGVPTSIALAVSRVDSPRYNTAMPGDVNGDQEMTALDALVVINDLGRLGSRTLSGSELLGDKVDVNNDGTVSPLDALRVINLLGQIRGEGESSVSVENSAGVEPFEAGPARAEGLLGANQEELLGTKLSEDLSG